MSNRFMTDGAGQELCAQLDKVIARFNGTTPPEVTSEDYDSKDFLSEETGRALADKFSDLSEAVDAYIKKNKASSYYGTCSTAAATGAKEVTCENFELTAGKRIVVKFTNANSASAPTLNVNNTGAKTIKSYGTTAGTLTNRWQAGAAVDFVYDGTNWLMTDPAVATGNAFGVVKATTLNGSANTAPSFYAPTGAGTKGQVLKSNGSGAPVWTNEAVDIGPAVVTLGESKTYNGSVQTQTVTSVVLSGVTLQEGEDYIVSGNTGTNAGTYSLLISGTGNYKGMIAQTWEIKRAASSISVNPTTMTIAGLTDLTKTATVTYTGDGNISVVSGNTTVAQASISGTTVSVVGVKSGNATITITLNAGQNYAASSCTINVTVAIPSSVFNDNPWSVVKTMSDLGLGASIWSVGDTKAVEINGMVGTTSMDTMLWVYILGFNHNESREGTRRIHLQGFKTAQTDGTDVGLVDSSYGSSYTDGRKVFNVNHWGNYNYGGWAACDARYDILGSTNVAPSNYGSQKSSGATGNNPTSSCATSPVANTLMAALPADLRAVMKPVTKYTDNKGGNSNAASNVTATTDYLWLLAEYEVQGTRTYANSYEQNYQEQYDYYANGNSKIKYKHTASSEAVSWRLRSPYYSNTTTFCTVYTDGSAINYGANNSRALAPAFAV